MTTFKGDEEEVQEGTGLKVLTPNISGVKSWKQFIQIKK